MPTERLVALKEAEQIVAPIMDYMASSECRCDLWVGVICEACEAKSNMNKLRKLIKLEEDAINMIIKSENKITSSL